MAQNDNPAPGPRPVDLSEPSTEPGPRQDVEEGRAAEETNGPARRGGGQRKKGGQKGRKGNQTPEVQVVEVKPAAGPARMKRRHWGVVASFLLVVLLPLAVVGGYLWTTATDQYASNTGFTVRQEEGSSATDILGGLAEFAGAGSTSADTDILYEFIQSQDLVMRVNERVDLRQHYSQHWPEDPAFALWPNASVEDLLWYWKRMIRVSYDQSTGLVELRVLAFDPETAQSIAQAIVAESQSLINELNATARADTMQYAEADLEEAQARLRDAREALTRFRTRTQIVDPESDIQGRMGVVNNLQQQLAQALIEFDMLTDGTGASDPRVNQAQRRIDVIRERIDQERETFTSGEVGVANQDYPTLMAEYESLVVEREFAEQNYTAALTALSSARSNASRQTRYLATYQSPTLPQTSGYPQRWMLFGLAAFFLFLAWSIMTLVYYSIRDRG